MRAVTQYRRAGAMYFAIVQNRKLQASAIPFLSRQFSRGPFIYSHVYHRSISFAIDVATPSSSSPPSSSVLYL